MRNKTLLLVMITALISIGLTYFFTKQASMNSSSTIHAAEIDDSHSDQPKTEIPGLKIEPAVMQESWELVTATGKVGPNADQVVKIGPRISGKITRINVNTGQMVYKGQVLAVLSSIELAQARAAYRQASAKLKAAKEAYNRQVELAKLGSFSKRPMEDARSEYMNARGDLAQAKEELIQNKSELARAQSELTQCKARLDRARELYKDEILSRHDLESAEAEYKRDSADIDTLKAKIRQTEAKIQQIEAHSQISNTILKREEKVFSTNLLARKEIQSAKAELTAAELEQRAAADTIRVLGASPSGSGETLAVTSPISGRVVSRNINSGEIVEPSSILFTVMNLADVWVEANIYEKDLARIHRGQPVEIRVESYPDQSFRGKVEYVGDVLDAESRTARVRSVVSNPKGLLKPEMFATIQIATQKRKNAVYLPKDAVLDEGGKKVVFLSCMECPEDQKAGKTVCGTYDQREVKVGTVRYDKVEVYGIQPGDLVITEAAYQLKTALGSGKLEAGCTDH